MEVREASGARAGPGGGCRARHAETPEVNPSRPFILRPVATSLLMAAILLAGFVAYRQLPVSALPQVDYPTIQVLTFYPGASPQVMASSVTAPLERQFGQVPGLKQMTSTSSFGSSVIILQFALDLNIDVAEQQVQAAINAAGTFLPRDLPNPPIYSKSNPADAPILTLALTSDSLPLTKVEDFADTTLAQKISQLPGVGLVSISGGQRPAVRIQANPTALASYGLSLEDLRVAMTQANVNQPKGNIESERQAFTINANDQLMSGDRVPAAHHRLPQWRAGAARRCGQRDRRQRERPAGRLDERDSGGDSEHPAPARREHHRGGRPHREAAAATQSLAAGSGQHTGADRPHHHHPRLRGGRRVRADAHRRPGRDGDLPVPAEPRRHGHSQRRRAALDRRHVRRDVPARATA